MKSAWSARQIATYRRNDLTRTAAREQLARTATRHNAPSSVRRGFSTTMAAFVRRFATAKPTTPATARRSLHDDA
jgi:hypothetical protein